jgi:hypothetical protein
MRVEKKQSASSIRLPGYGRRHGERDTRSKLGNLSVSVSLSDRRTKTRLGEIDKPVGDTERDS